MTDNAPDLDAVQRQVGVLLARGDPSAARTLIEQSLPFAEAERKPGRIASFLVLLATCHGQLMRSDAAESAFDGALRSADETLEPGHPVRVVVIASWAAFERSRGALDAEKRLWQLVLPVLQSDPRFAGVLRDCLRSLEELETNAPKERQLRDSFERLREADLGQHASVNERGAAFEAVRGSTVELGRFFEGMRRRRELSTLLRDCYIMRPEELWRRLTAVGASHRQPVLDEQRCRFNLFLNGLLQSPRIEGVQTALETLAWRRGIGLEIHRCANRLARREPEVRQTLDAIRFARAKYAEELFAAPPDAKLRPRNGIEITLEPIERNFDYQQLEAKLLARLEPQVNRFVSRPVDCAELASRIPAEGVLIEYCRCTWPDGQGGVAASYVALVLPANRPDRAGIVHLCESAQLEELLFEYLSLLCGRSKTADFRPEVPGQIQSAAARELGHKLRMLVLDPLLPWTQPDNVKHLLLVTDGLLGRLPFSALPLIDGYMLDRWLISYLHTSRDLFVSDEATGASGQPLVVCEPAYDWSGPMEKDGFRFRPLEWAAREGDAVGKLLGVKPMTSTDATKTALTKACRSPGDPAYRHARHAAAGPSVGRRSRSRQSARVERRGRAAPGDPRTRRPSQGLRADVGTPGAGPGAAVDPRAGGRQHLAGRRSAASRRPRTAS